MSADTRVGRDQAVYLLGIRVELDAERANAIPGAPGSKSADGTDVDAPVTGTDIMLGSVLEELQHLAEALLRSHGFGDALVMPAGVSGGVRYVRTYTLRAPDVEF